MRVKTVLSYLIKHNLLLVTAESCTAGQVLAMLGKQEGCGVCLDVGFVVYSEQSKKHILKVKQKTIDTYTLTSEAVALEMVRGALRASRANIALATTGLTGKDPMDGIKPGTICFAWAWIKEKKIVAQSETVQFEGSRKQLQVIAARHALNGLVAFHKSNRL